MATREELAFALATLMEGVKEHDLPGALGLDPKTCKRLFNLAQEAQAEIYGKPKDFFYLQPNYSGYFEVFWFEGERYARLKEDQGAWHSWYVWKDNSDSFKCLDSEEFVGNDLSKRLESLYLDQLLEKCD